MALPLNLINTEVTSAHLRDRAVNVPKRQLLITRLAGSDQESDLTIPPNCNGLGRIRHFHRSYLGNSQNDEKLNVWPNNPLPIDPALKALGMEPANMLKAQVFQNAACNWRCWYCFVPFELLSANPKYSIWISAEELVDLYLTETERPLMIDLTGGQPDLVPEWVPWTMQALRDRGLEGRVYLWSDDNLSNDYFWRYLTDADRELICGFQGYGRVCCFKGFNSESFTFNTRAHADLFAGQFALFERLLSLGIDLYAYATFTTPNASNIEDDIARFVDRLQAIAPNLPLRTVPLEIRVFAPVAPRIEGIHQEAMRLQWRAIEAWQNELERRFSSSQLSMAISEVVL